MNLFLLFYRMISGKNLFVIAMNIIKTQIPDLLVLEPEIVTDDRGFFMETFQSKRYEECGINCPFVQDNISESIQGTLRGLHYQYPHSQGKLVQVISGSVFDVAVDIRRGSPSYGKWFGTEISAENKRQLWLPSGCAHGFCVISGTALFSYKCTDFYNPKTEHTIIWNDEEIGIDWPVSEPVISSKDANGIKLKNMPLENFPTL